PQLINRLKSALNAIRNLPLSMKEIKLALGSIAAKRLTRAFALEYCVLGKNSVLYEEAEICNNLGKKENIVIGNNSHIRGQLLTFGHGGKIVIGDYCYVGRHS